MSSPNTHDSRLTPLNVGVVPRDWTVAPLKSVATSIRNGFVGVSLPHQTDETGVRYLQGFNIRPNKIELTNKTFVTQRFVEDYPKSRLEAFDILTVQSGHIGTSALVPPSLAGSSCHALIITRLKPGAISPHYVVAYLNSHIGQARMRGLHVGSSIVHINTSELADYLIPIPPLPEQQKIADILGTWDEALEKLDALIAAKARRKQALMQQLLTGRRRLPGSIAPVKFIRASELFTNRTERNSQGAPILSVTQDQGVVLRDTLERKIAHDIETNDTYKVVHPGDYIISLRSFQGGLEYSEILGAVSPAYHVIHPIKDIDREFYRHYFKSADFVSRLAVAVIGIRDGKQISFTDFGFIKLPYPHIDDQKRIGQLLSTADTELRLLRQQRTALDHQKRGLMQQLLTGKVRVAA